ncbi:MAG TPA: citrate synthase [Streptosporangiaceae bacterium]|nr:citrate synthase [Streptosporangiaceae bacterium]
MSYELTAAQAAERLGVKPATLYAYVSRGVLTRGRAADGRASLFDADEVERLARRGRPRRPAGAVDIIVESRITEITADRLRYRGHDVVELARTRSFEDVAELLWTGELPTGSSTGGWRAPEIALAAGRAAQAALPAGTLPLERFQVIVPALAATDPLRLELDPVAVVAAARTIVAGLVDCLPGAAGPSDGTPIAIRLWSRLCQRRASPALLRALSAALVLLADHELAASTLAARAAASVRADPYAVVATGLGAVGGALHGGSSLGAESMLAAAAGPADVPRVVAELLRRGEKVPGFGHYIYKAGDPRAIALLGMIRHAAPKSAQLAIAEAVLVSVRRKSLPEPNIDFALATLARVAGMTRGAAEAIFAVARVAGWVAHALEAYTTAPIRPRAIYIGPPAANGGA